MRWLPKHGAGAKCRILAVFRDRKRSGATKALLNSAKQVGLFAAIRGLYNLWRRKQNDMTKCGEAGFKYKR